MSRKDNLTLIHTHIGPAVLYGLLRMGLGSCRVTVHNDEYFKSRGESGQNMLLVSWHSRLIPLSYYYRYLYGFTNLTIMVSKSRDGELFKRLLEKFKIETVRGSTTRGAMAAMKELIRVARRGRDTSLALDGSKGPKEVVQPGSLLLAQMTGVPLVPVVLSATWKYELPTWDRMLLPLPFSHIHALFAEPLYIPRETKDLEPYREQLQKTMQTASAEVERLTFPKQGEPRS